MTARFAAAQARLNQAVFRHLPNETAVLDGNAVDVIFDRNYLAVDGMGSTSPAALADSELVATATQASTMVVRGNTYRVRSIEPDGTGSTLLRLELQ